MKEIEVITQTELDDIDINFDGVIKILGIGIHVSLRYKYQVLARGNSSVVAWDNSSVVARDNSSVEARGNSSVVARENSSVVAMDNSSVLAWENSSVVAMDNSSVEARGNVCVRIFASIKKLSLFGFSVLFKPFELNFNFEAEKTCLIQQYKKQKYLDREGIEINDNSVILFKKISKDNLTQENTKNETKWEIGATLTHPKWNPSSGECGEGKYHACSRPYFCDEFRNQKGDKYIAIKVEITDLYEWENPSYPHKIAFREGKVLYEVDRFGAQI